MLVFFAFCGMLAGLLLFFRGFRMLRYKRMILNTPLSKIHSASIGLVELNGTPAGPLLLWAPITGDPCYYYRARAWQWVESEKSGQGGKWRPVFDESLSVPFFLEDGTGKVLVHPHSADMDVHRNFSDEVGASFFQSRDLLPQNIRNFLAWRGLVPYEKIKLEERAVKPGYPLFVFGTLGENSDASRFRILLNRLIPGPKPQKVVEQFECQVPAGPGPLVLPDGVAAAMAQSGVALPIVVPPESAQQVGSSSTAPRQDSQARTNDANFDLHTSVAVGKGQRNEPFTISSYSQRELVDSLAWKSIAHIWGGPVLTLCCFYFLMIYFGWKL